MTTKIEEFVAVLGWEVDPGKLDEFNNQVNGLVTTFAKVAAAVVGATAAVTAFAVVTNKQTSINARLAESIDLSAESLENWTFLLGAIDFNAEKVVRTVKTLNDRLGQVRAGIGDAATVKDAVKALNLEFKDLERLAPEEQLKTILQASKDLEDGQTAAAAATQLLGRQGAFMVGFLRDQEGTIEELLTLQAQYNLLTEEGRESAKEFTGLWDNFNAVIDSAKAAFAAYLGDALAPLLKEFLKFVRENRELIKLRIAEWAERVGRFLGFVWDVLRGMFDILSRIVDAFGGLENVLKAVVAVGSLLFLSKMVRLLQALGPLVLTAVSNWRGLVTALGAKAKLAGVLGLLVLAGLAINSLIRFFQGRDSLVGDIGLMIAKQMDIALEKMAEFFGFSKKEFDEWLIDIDQGFRVAFSTAWDVVSGFFKEVAGLLSPGTWAPILDAYQAVWSQFANWFQDFWRGVVDWIASFVPDGILNAIRSVLPRVSSLLSQIPGVGGALAGVVDAVKGIADAKVQVRQTTEQTAPRRPGQPPPTAPAIQAAQLNPLLRNVQTSIDRSARTSNQEINNTFNVNQRRDENSQSFERRALDVVERAAASAMRTTDTGVLR